MGRDPGDAGDFDALVGQRLGLGAGVSPLNPFDAGFRSFEQQVLPEVNRRGMAALGMKSMGGTASAVKNHL